MECIMIVTLGRMFTQPGTAPAEYFVSVPEDATPQEIEDAFAEMQRIMGRLGFDLRAA